MDLLSLTVMAIWGASVVNVLPDASFEEGQWELAKWDYGTSRHEFASPGRTGEKCVHLVGVSDETGRINELAISPVLPAQAGQEYVMAVWYRTQGDARPSLSCITYKEPFATAAWKTPQAQYDSKPLEPSDEWRLGLWRVRAAEGAVEMRVMVRLGGKGEAWYDDVSLVPRTDATAITTAAGDVCELPDKRLYAARIKAPADTSWSLTLVDATGRELARSEGRGPNPATRVTFSSPAGKAVIALLSVGDMVADYTEFTVPQLLELNLSTCRYRNAVYQSAAPQRIEGEITAHATEEVLRRFSYRAALVPAEQPAVSGKWQAMRQARQALSVDARGLKPGSWRMVVQLRGVPDAEAFEVPIRVLPKGTPHEVIIDDWNRLLVDGKPLFPCGFYGAPSEDDRTRSIVEAGYNTVLTYETNPESCRKWLDMCHRLGLWGIVHLPRPFVDHFDETKLREAIRVVKNHPALLAYYLIDEPSPANKNQKPEDLKRVYDVLCDEDPYHPVTICINVPANETVYLDCYDVLMIDVYPVRFRPQPLATIGDRMDHAWRSTGGRKPVWFIPQSFGWDVVEGLDREPTWLTPTPEQERVMQYLSLAHGARGSIAYCYHVYTSYDAEATKQGKWPWKKGGYLPDKQQKLWEGLVAIGGEYKLLSTALVQPNWATASFEQGRLHVGWYYGGGDVWLVTVNTDEKESVEAGVPAVPAQNVGKPVGALDAFTQKPVVLQGEKIVVSLPPMGTTAIKVTLAKAR